MPTEEPFKREVVKQLHVGQMSEWLSMKKNEKVIRIGGIFDTLQQTHQAGSIYDTDGLAPCLDTATGGYRQPLIIIYENNKKI